MTSIALTQPKTRIVTLTAKNRLAYLQGLNTHFSRGEDSTIGCKLHSSGNTLYMWPKADPTRWTYILSTTVAGSAAMLTGWLDWGQDP